MKRNSINKLIAASALSLAMVGTLAPSMLKAKATQTSPTFKMAMEVTKKEGYTGPLIIPAETFKYTATPEAASLTWANQPVKAGPANAVTITDITTETKPEDFDVEGGTKAYETNIAVDYSKFVDAYAVPGIYTYKITQDVDASPISSITYSTEYYYLVVYVLNDGSKEVIVVDDNGKKTNANNLIPSTDEGSANHNVTDTPSFKFTNSVSYNSLKVTQTLTGNQSVATDALKYTLSSDAASNTVYVKQGTTYTALKSAAEFTLNGNDASLEIVGLLDSDKVSVVSKEAHNKTTMGYTQKTGTDYETAKTVSGAQTLAIEQNKESDIATGIIRSYGPYALMVVLGAAFIFFFVGKRNKEDEEEANA